MRINTETTITLNETDARAISRVGDILSEIKAEFVMQTLTENGKMVDESGDIIVTEDEVTCAIGTLEQLFTMLVNFNGEEPKTTNISFED